MEIVPATTTPLAPEAAANWLTTVITLDREQAPLILALVWVETGGGDLIQHNPGNVTASENWGGKAWRPPWYEPPATEASERLKRLHLAMLEGKAPRAFRAYDSFADGFADFAAVLRRSFPEVLSAGSSGDVPAFVRALSQRYSKDYGAQHHKAFASWQAKFKPLFAHLPKPHTVSPFLLLLLARALT